MLKLSQPDVRWHAGSDKELVAAAAGAAAGDAARGGAKGGAAARAGEPYMTEDDDEPAEAAFEAHFKAVYGGGVRKPGALCGVEGLVRPSDSQPVPPPQSLTSSWLSLRPALPLVAIHVAAVPAVPPQPSSSAAGSPTSPVPTMTAAL